jgi:DNA-binding transcriptional LysR family regulator
MTPPLHSIISSLHLKQLRLPVALGEHGSLLKASQQVALTQPGARKALQEIETTFGTPLFVAPIGAWSLVPSAIASSGMRA